MPDGPRSPDLAIGSFTERGPWVVDPDAMAWRVDVDRLREQARAEFPRWMETGRLPPEALLARILPDLRELLGVTGAPVFTHHTFWPRAIAQYNVGHERFLEPLARCENLHAGLFIGGSARDGISLPDCLKAGAALAKKALDFAEKL